MKQRFNLPKHKVDNVLKQVKGAEKSNFAHYEVLDFDLELKKRNTNLAIVLDFPSELDDAVVATYLIYARCQKIVLLHKVCALKDYRRRGIGKDAVEQLEGTRVPKSTALG